MCVHVLDRDERNLYSAPLLEQIQDPIYNKRFSAHPFLINEQGGFHGSNLMFRPIFAGKYMRERW